MFVGLVLIVFTVSLVRSVVESPADNRLTPASYSNELITNSLTNSTVYALDNPLLVNGSVVLFNGLNWSNTTNLVLWWKMNEGSGNTTQDYSGSGYHGTLRNGTSGSVGVTCNWDSLVGCAKWSPGFINNASLSFNELPLNTSFVMVNLSRYNESVTNQFTWAGWINVRNYSNVLPRIWSKTTHYLTIQNTGGNTHMGRLVFETQNQTGNASDFYATGTNAPNFSQGQNRDTWIFVAFTYNGSDPQVVETGNQLSNVGKFYINGVGVNTTFVTQCTGCTRPGLLASTFNRNFTVGGASLREFNGSSSNVMVFNTTLTADEINLLYLSTSDYYQLNAGNYSVNNAGSVNIFNTNVSVFGMRLFGNYSNYTGTFTLTGLQQSQFSTAAFAVNLIPFAIALLVLLMILGYIG